jgi:hypothetical protein
MCPSRMWPVSKRVNVSGLGDDDPSLAQPSCARKQPHHVSDLKTCGHNVDLKKPAQKAVLHVGGINQHQNDGEPASGKKNKALEE